MVRTALADALSLGALIAGYWMGEPTLCAAAAARPPHFVVRAYRAVKAWLLRGGASQATVDAHPPAWLTVAARCVTVNLADPAAPRAFTIAQHPMNTTYHDGKTVVIGIADGTLGHPHATVRFDPSAWDFVITDLGTGVTRIGDEIVSGTARRIVLPPQALYLSVKVGATELVIAPPPRRPASAHAAWSRGTTFNVRPWRTSFLPTQRPPPPSPAAFRDGIADATQAAARGLAIALERGDATRPLELVIMSQRGDHHGRLRIRLPDERGEFELLCQLLRVLVVHIQPFCPAAQPTAEVTLEWLDPAEFAERMSPWICLDEPTRQLVATDGLITVSSPTTVNGDEATDHYTNALRVGADGVAGALNHTQTERVAAVPPVIHVYLPWSPDAERIRAQILGVAARTHRALQAWHAPQELAGIFHVIR